MDPATRISVSPTASNVPLASSAAAGPNVIPRNPTDPGRVGPQDKRFSQQPQHSQPPKRIETNAPKRSGFGIFGRSKDEDDERDQLKRLKAENKLLRAQLKELEIKSSQIGAENERYKSSLVGDRKINNQLHPDSYYASALERLSVGITDWTVSHFRGKNSREYTPEMVDEIRNGLKKLSDANNLIPPTLHWSDIDLQSALTDSKFRIAFVLHVIGLHLHEKVFSPFSYEIEDFGLGYWLKRISDEVARSGSLLTTFANEGDNDVYFKWDWSKTLFKAIPAMFEGTSVEGRITRRIKRILRSVHPRDIPDDAIFDKLQEYISSAIEIAIAMRLEQARFVSTFPIQGAAFLPNRHTTGGDEQTGAIRMCTFPGIIKQTMFLGASTSTDISIFKARVHLESSFQKLPLSQPIESENLAGDELR
jgi:hypothetical protein